MNPFRLQNGREEFKKALFRNAMKNNWEEVINIYKSNKESHTAKITRSGDTALHIAISNGKESIVEKLVAILREALELQNYEPGSTPPQPAVETRNSAFETQNVLGNTPLHLAASLGNAKMCRCIARCNSELMGMRNNDQETPFFLAVRHGRKEAFQAMHKICKKDDYCRGKDGETILHAALYGEYFDLAFDIMNHYDKLINMVDVYGITPLHILASKPSAFGSGSHIRGLEKLIYHCIFVDELETKSMDKHDRDLHQYKEGAKYPENYHTCFTISNLLRDVMRVLLGYTSKRHTTTEHEQNAEETPESTTTPQQDEIHSNSCKQLIVNILCGNSKAEEERHQFVNLGSSKDRGRGQEILPKNYITFFNFIKLLSKGMLVILGLGSKSVNKIREKKSKHIWSLQIMERLLDDASPYEYENTGKTPGIGPTSQGTDAETPLPYTLPSEAAGAADFNPSAFDGGAAAHEDPKPADPPKPPVESADREKHCAALKSALESVGLVKRKVSSKGNLPQDMEKKETPILIAAKSGVEEIVAGILERFPVAIHDMNSEKKNAVLLAVEHRQPHVYKLLLDRNMMMDTVFRKTDKDGNSALHLAARLGEYRPWLIPGAALQMQWEIKWHEFVKDSMPHNFFPRNNNESKTSKDIFSESHADLVKEGREWLTSTSQSCSVVAALIATVAFATSATVPGGVKSDNSGTPTLQDEPAFSIFAISSLVALCFSVTSVIMFLAILTSRFQEKDFGKDLPRKLLVGLTSLFISIGSMLLSFCAGHFFVLRQKLQYTAFPMYAITCLPVTFFAINQFPLYFDLVRATIRKVPQRSSQ